MAVTADEIISLAQHCPALTEAQRADIIEVSPRMPEDDLKKVKVLMFRLAQKQGAYLKEELEMWAKLSAEYRKADREKREGEEAESHAKEEANVEKLISEL